MSEGKPRRGSVVVLVALAIVLAGIGLRWFLNRPPSTASAAPQQPAVVAPATGGRVAGGANAAKHSTALVRVPSVASAKFHRDPFASAAVFPPKSVVDGTKPSTRPVDVTAEVVAEARSDLRLTAISVGGDKPLAIISGKTYREGDMVGPFRVERIGQFEVVMEQRGVRVVLSKE